MEYLTANGETYIDYEQAFKNMGMAFLKYRMVCSVVLNRKNLRLKNMEITESKYKDIIAAQNVEIHDLKSLKDVMPSTSPTTETTDESSSSNAAKKRKVDTKYTKRSHTPVVYNKTNDGLASTPEVYISF